MIRGNAGGSSNVAYIQNTTLKHLGLELEF